MSGQDDEGTESPEQGAEALSAEVPKRWGLWGGVP